MGAWQVSGVLCAVASCLLRNLGCGLSHTQASRAAIYRCALRIIHSSPTISSSLFSTASHTMSADPSISTSHSKFNSVFNAALEKYKRKTKQDLAKHPLLPRLQSCASPEAILAVLREQTRE